MKLFYQHTIDAIVQQVKTDVAHGLTDSQVRERQARDGYNILPDVKRRSIFSIFISQFQNPLIYILLIASVIIFVVGDDKLDAFIISGVLFFNAILGTVQEGRTRNIIESLRRLIKTDSIVLRNGIKAIVEDSQLVVGGVILLSEGQRVPADARIIESNNLQVDESVLTGESESVRKTIDVIEQDVSIGDRINMLYKGTYVLSGSGKAVVVGIGVKTEIGKIHKTVEQIETEIPLRKELDHLSYWILIFIFGMCFFLFIMGIFTGKPIKELLIMLTALFICVIPEGLPVVLTLVLVTGALRMSKQFVLVKNMQAVEALGRTDVIVIDKTGTLTRNEMIVSRVFADEQVWQVTGQGYHVEGGILKNNEPVESVDKNSALQKMGIISSLLNSSEVTYVPKLDLFDIKGDPTEAAMFVFSKKLGLSTVQLEQEYTKVYEIPFESALRFHAGFYKKDNKCLVFVAGSPEVLMQQAGHVNNSFTKELEQFLEDGLRVVTVGMKEFSCDLLPSEEQTDKQRLAVFTQLVSHDMQLLGLSGIEDSIRPEVAGIVTQARNAGLMVIMATGDHQKTALHVAKQVGIYQKGDDIIDGPEFEKLSDDALLKRIEQVTVFSRVSPDHKVRIVTIFHQLNKIVAMTGDGINDAPSLVAADLGIAMGGIGTEVAKQASDLILLNDSFVNIIRAIEQGRHIFYTIKRVVLYFFATNMGEILIILFAFLLSFINGFDLPLPITAAQILWLNFVTDGFLDIGISMEPKEKGLLSKYWLERKPRLVDGALFAKMLFIAVPMGIGSLWVFLHYYQADVAHARTMTLITMAMFQWFNAWNCRSTRLSLFQLGLFTNKWLLLATAFVLSLQFVILYVPFMQHIFKTVPLSFADWTVIVLVSAPILLLEELRKVFVRRWYVRL